MPINPYDDLVTEVFSETENANPVEQAASEIANQSKQQVLESMYAGTRQDPDRAAEVQRLAQKTQLPIDVVDRKFDVIKEKDRMESTDYDRLIEETPQFASWLKDPKNSSVAHDDIESLQYIERQTKFMDFARSQLKNLTVGTAQMAESVARIPSLLVDVSELPYNLGAKLVGGPQKQKIDWLDNNSVTEYFQGVQDKNQTPELSMSVASEIGKGNYSNAAQAAVAQFFVNAPQQAANLAAFFASGGVSGMLVAGLTSAASANKEGKDSGVDPVSSTVNSIMSGTIEASFERLGTFGILKRWEGAIAKEYGKEVSKEFFKQFGKTVAYSMAGEANEEALTSIAQDFSSYITGVNPDGLKGIGLRAVDAGIAGAVSGGVMTAPSAFGAGVTRGRQSAVMNTANSSKEFYVQIGDVVTQSKLHKRSPEALQSAVSEITKGSGVETVYIPVESFTSYAQSQKVDEAKLIQDIGIASAVDEARATGGDIAIKFSEFVAKTAGTEHYAGLANDIKFAPEDLTIAQVRAEAAQVKQELKVEDEAAVADDVDQTAQVESVVTEVRRQLKDAGLDTSQAELVRGIGVLAQREGLDPQEFLQSLNLKIGRGTSEVTVGAGETMAAQASEPAKKTFFQKVAEAVGITKPAAPVQVEAPAAAAPETAAPKPAFFSKLAQTVDQKMGNSATVEQVNGILRDIKPEERKWSGVDEFLKGKEKVSKADLQQFLAANALEIQEVTKGVGASADTEAREMALVDQVIELEREEKTAKEALTKAKDAFIDGVFKKTKNTSSALQAVRDVAKSLRPGEIPLTDYAGVDATALIEAYNKSSEVFDKMQPLRTELQALRDTRADSGTKYEKYTLPGGENYREVLFTLPESKPPEQITELPEGYKVVETQAKIKFGMGERADKLWPAVYEALERNDNLGFDNQGLAIDTVMKEGLEPWVDGVSESDQKLINDFVVIAKEDAAKTEVRYSIVGPGDETISSGYKTAEEATNVAIKNINKAERKWADRATNYKSGHFQEANVLAHTRLNERTDSEGNKVLFVEEIQSDWHQDGRKKGYKPDSISESALTDAVAKTDDARKAYAAELKNKYIPEKVTLKDFKKKGVRETLGSTYTEWEDLFGERENGWEVSKLGNVYTLQKHGRTIQEYRTQKELNADLRQMVVDNTTFGSIEDKLNDEERAKLKELKDAADAAQDARTNSFRAVPDAPFRKTWHEFVMKRLIREAAEKGFDKIAWTTGEQQADRYSLAKQADSIRAFKNSDGTFDVEVFLKGGSTKEQNGLDASKLESAFGKELAEKIIAESGEKVDLYEDGNVRVYKGDDLKVGGEGMKGFYDKILVQFADKFGKKYGAKVGETQIAAGGSNTIEGEHLYVTDIKTFDGPDDRFGTTSGFIVRDVNQGQEPVENKTFQTKAEADAFLKELLNRESNSAQVKVHSLDITPQLRDAALNEGFSLFQGGDQTPRGQIKFGDSGISIDILKNADPSTFIHETGHLYLEVLGRLAAREGATAETKQDFKTILDWFGVESAEQITVDHHEKFARGFEKYLGEGVAPSKGLKKAFKKFKTWILSVYGDLKRLNVDLSAEVRQVFDRILAGDAAVERAEQQMSYGPLFGDPAAVGMTEEQALKYREAQSEAQDAAKQRVNSKLLKELREKQSEQYATQRAAVQSEVTAQANASKVYNAISMLQNNTAADGTPAAANVVPIKIATDAVLKDERELFPRGIWAKDGVDPDTAALLLGFPSGEQLLNSLRDAPAKADLIAERTDAEMAVRFPELIQTGQLDAEAVEAVHNESRAAMLRMELEHLASNNLPVLKTVIRRVARRVPTQAVIRSQAEQIISGKNVKELKPYLYTRAEVKAANEAADLLVKGDIDGAFAAKQRELLNHELFLATTNAKESVEKNLKKFKKISKGKIEDISKSRDADIVNAARFILSQYGLGRETDKNAEQYLAQLKQYDPDTYNSVSSLINSAMENAGPYTDMTFDKFSDMADSVNALWGLSKTSKQMTIDGRTMSRDEAKAELQAKISEYSNLSKVKPGMSVAVSDAEKRKVFLLGAKAALVRTEAWAETMDVGSKGPFRKYIWEPISRATSQYRLNREDVYKKYEAILKEYAPQMTRDPIKAPEIDYTFKDKSELMMAVLHSGNESNLSKLLRGRNWGMVDETGQLDKTQWQSMMIRLFDEGVLKKADYDFAQKVWDLMESMKPAAQSAHKKMYGYYFNEITAQEIETPFGNYKGGYIPAKVDAYTNEDTKIRQERELFEQNNNSFQFPTTGRGFTKSRVDQYAAPLNLDMNLLAGHIDGVMRFTHIEPAVKEVARLVNDKEFRAALATVDTETASEMLIPWLQRAAQQKVVLPSDSGIGKLMDRGAAYLRRTVAMQIMFGSVTNTLEQFTGVVIAAAKVKPRYLRDSLVLYIKDTKAMTSAMLQKSEYMRSTQGSNLYETKQGIQQIIVDPTVYEKVRTFAEAHVYVLQSMTQNIVNSITWNAAYNQAIEQGKSEDQAVSEGDSAVRMTQGSNNPEDISRLETGTATQRLFTQFAGYFNMLANLQASEVQKISRDMGLRKGAGKLFYVYTATLMIPSILSALLRRAMSGEPLDEDDDGYLDDALAVFFGSQAGTVTAMIPGIGQATNAMLNRFNDKLYDDRLSLSPVVSTIESMVGVPAEVYKAIVDDASNPKKAVKDSLMLIGIASSLPVGPLGKPVGYLMDVTSGDAQPTGPVDFTRGLITGRKGSN